MKRNNFIFFIGTLLKQYHVDRIKQADEIIDQRQLAEEFGIDYPTFNKYYNDKRQPKYDIENKRKLIEKLGDAVYEAMGETPPNPVLTKLQELEQSDNPEAEEIFRLIGEWLSAHGFIKTKDTRDMR